MRSTVIWGCLLVAILSWLTLLLPLLHGLWRQGSMILQRQRQQRRLAQEVWVRSLLACPSSRQKKFRGIS